MIVTYPVIFTETNDNKNTVLIEVPDLEDALSEGYGMEDAIYMAKDVIREIIWDLLDDEEEIPTPTDPEDIDISEGRFFDAGVSQVMEVTVAIDEQ